MGEIADMMLDGILCEGCGEYLEGDGDGFPRYCSDACARDRGVEPEGPEHRNPKRNRPAKPGPLPLCAKDARFLQSIVDGRISKVAPLTKRMGRMVRRGFLDISDQRPSQPTKGRLTVTDAGRKAIKDANERADWEITF